jgi:hypothetical protein
MFSLKFVSAHIERNSLNIYRSDEYFEQKVNLAMKQTFKGQYYCYVFIAVLDATKQNGAIRVHLLGYQS